MADHVELDLPLAARYASTVRAAAASLAAGLGLTVDGIDDLRLGVNEAISVLTDVDEVAGGRLHVRFDTSDDAIVVTASRRGVNDADDVELDVLARRIMEAVVDEFDVDESGAVSISKRLVVDGVS